MLRASEPPSLEPRASFLIFYMIQPERGSRPQNAEEISCVFSDLGSCLMSALAIYLQELSLRHVELEIELHLLSRMLMPAPAQQSYLSMRA